MNNAGIKAIEPFGPGSCCIVGYGNSHRQDDGLGPYVAALAKSALEGCPGIKLLACLQLETDLLEELKEADTVILVDATGERIPEGRRWERIEPRPDRASSFSHSLQPDLLMGLLGLLYQKYPAGWLVSVQGEDFGLGEGLTPEAEARARQVVADLEKLVSKVEKKN
ncbi:MAG: hydrogenase maturation protease [Pseudomonadota bacterium]